MNNLKQINKFLEMYNLSRLNQEEIWNMNRQLSVTKLNLLTNKQKLPNLPTNKSPGPDSFTGKSYQASRKRVNIYYSQTIPKNCRARNDSEFILWVQHHSDTKTGQTYLKTYNYRTIILLNRNNKNLQ